MENNLREILRVSRLSRDNKETLINAKYGSNERETFGVREHVYGCTNISIIASVYLARADVVAGKQPVTFRHTIRGTHAWRYVVFAQMILESVRNARHASRFLRSEAKRINKTVVQCVCNLHTRSIPSFDKNLESFERDHALSPPIGLHCTQHNKNVFCVFSRRGESAQTRDPSASAPAATDCNRELPRSYMRRITSQFGMYCDVRHNESHPE